MAELSFADQFTRLTGNGPFPWQSRLYDMLLQEGSESKQPIGSLDIPTGLGKTSVMAIWLIARAAGAPVPTRLIYCVDRRAVVDQATDEAERLRENLPTDMAEKLRLPGGRLPISTLRGGFQDNRDWLADPTAPAIIVGTVDMIGSRLLFEGYGVGPRMRPYHAGSLGADSLLVLDEAHLAQPFAALLAAVARPDVFGASTSPAPVRLLQLSATGRDGGGFALGEADRQHPVVAARTGAMKRLSVEDAQKPDARTIAETAMAIAAREGGAPKVVIYLNSRDLAGKVAQSLDKAKAGETILLVGARRGLERDAVAGQLQRSGFTGERPASGDTPAFLVATAAGEVGVDLDADHMVADLVPWERMVQRLGRVNRRGRGNARCIVLDFREDALALPADKDEKARELDRRAATRALLERLPPLAEGLVQASPAALGEVRDRDPSAVAAASTPAPLHPALTRPLVDAWSMTSLPEHTGRPEVAPWLRGWIDEEPQTRVLWRAHLPTVKTAPGADEADEGDVNAFFSLAPPHLSEVLETETGRLVGWLLGKRTGAAARAGADDGGEAPTAETIAGFVLDAGLRRKAAITFGTIREARAGRLQRRAINDLERILAGATLVLDRRVGGLSNGLLSDDLRPVDPVADSAEWQTRPDGAPLVRFRVARREAQEASRAEPGWRPALVLDCAYDASGEVSEVLEVLTWLGGAEAGESTAVQAEPVTLRDHTRHVEDVARGIVERVDLPPEERAAVVIAARLHDRGKAARIWQSAMNAPAGGPFAKTRGGNGKLLAGYRHEFGSLVEAGTEDLPDDTRDLILHLVAAHHGFARPLIPSAGCEAGPPSVMEAVAGEAARRFARLQRRYGPWGLAWREALLRAADQQASRAEEESAARASSEAA